jgi:hypothetical protein
MTIIPNKKTITDLVKSVAIYVIFLNVPCCTYTCIEPKENLEKTLAQQLSKDIRDCEKLAIDSYDGLGPGTVYANFILIGRTEGYIIREFEETIIQKFEETYRKLSTIFVNKK